MSLRQREGNKLHRNWWFVVIGALLAINGGARAQAPPATGDRGSKAAILPLTDEITDVTVESLKRRISEARKQGAAVLIFELNTPGGLVSSSIAVADLIKNLTGVKTVAWVNTEAHSGGAIVAVACNEIVMARSSRIGDSQVIMAGPEGIGAVPEDLQPKAYTPVLAEFRASCRLNGYDQTLCEAFVLPELEVWWVENTRTGERRFVLTEKKQELLGENDEPTAAKTTDDTRDAQEDGAAWTAKTGEVTSAKTDWKLVERYFDSMVGKEVATKQPIVPGNQLLEMSPGEAQAYGFSKGIVADEAELIARYQLATLIRIAPSWSEVLAHWLTSIYVRGFLMMLILLGLYVEFHTPGLGVAGLVALICLAIFVGAPYITGLANVWEIVCMVIGIVLIVVEIFVIPGFTVAGISGIALVFIGLLATFLPEEPGHSFPFYWPSLPSSMYYLKAAVTTVVCSMAASLVGMVMLSRVLPRLPVLGRIIPANPTPSEVQVGDAYRGLARVGDTGETVGPLRPAGKARFSGELVDVVTQGEYLAAGARVEVMEHRGNRVVVRAV